MDPTDQRPQGDLFGSAPAEADFAVTLLGLAAIKGLGRQGILALTELTDDHLGRIWQYDPAVILATLTKAKVTQASAVVPQLLNSETVLQVGRERLEELQAQKVHVLGPQELPPDLRRIPSAPRWLFVQGNPLVLYRKPMVAVVGTRDSTPQGRTATRFVVRLLAGYPAITVVSGLAEGIDDEAHRAALDNRLANIAFLGHGIDIVFPHNTRGTRERILEQGGAIATEYLPGEMYQKSYFVQRNRLQAGLADVVIAVEAQAKSGTARTVEFALKFKRPVVGVRVPGSTIADEIEKVGQLVVDFSQQEGVRTLDAVLRRQVEKTGHIPDPFGPIVDRLKLELKIRSVPPSALQQLAAELFTVVMQEHARVKKDAKGELP